MLDVKMIALHIRLWNKAVLFVRQNDFWWTLL